MKNLPKLQSFFQLNLLVGDFYFAKLLSRIDLRCLL